MVTIHYGNDNGYSSSGEAIVSFVGYCICVSLSAVILVRTWYQLFVRTGNKTSQLYHKSMLITAMLSLCFNLLFCVVTLIIHIRYIFSSEPYSCLVSSVNSAFLGTARFCLYLFFLARFSGVFKGTSMDLSSQTYVMMVLGMFSTVYGGVAAFLWASDMKGCFAQERYYGLVAGAAQDIFWSLATMYLFISRLDSISKMLASSVSGSHGSRMRSQSDHSRSQQNVQSQTGSQPHHKNSQGRQQHVENHVKMLRFCIRLAILTICTTISTLIVIPASTLVNPALATSIDSVLNGFCLTLTFSSNNKIYHKLCSKLITCFKKIVTIHNMLHTSELQEALHAKEMTDETPHGSRLAKHFKLRTDNSNNSKQHSGPLRVQVDGQDAGNVGTATSTPVERSPAPPGSPCSGGSGQSGDNGGSRHTPQPTPLQNAEIGEIPDTVNIGDNQDNSERRDVDAIETPVDIAQNWVDNLAGFNQANNRRNSVTVGTIGGSKAVNLVESKNLADAFFIDANVFGNDSDPETEQNKIGAHGVVEAVDLKDLTYDLRIKGKKNKAKVARIDLKAIEADEIVADQVGTTQLKGRRNTLTGSMTVSAPDITAFRRDSEALSGRDRGNSGDGGLRPVAEDANDGQNANSTGAGGLGGKPRISLILYELRDVVATNCGIYDSLRVDETVDVLSRDEIELSFGGESRLDELKSHLEFVLDKNYYMKGGKRVEKKPSDDRVLCFLLANVFNTDTIHEIIKRANLSDYFKTQLKKTKYMCHVIGKNHFVKQDVDDKEYLSILKIIYVLNREHENVLFVSHNKELIQHLTQINACHTYYVKTKGMTVYDMERITDEFAFGGASSDVVVQSAQNANGTGATTGSAASGS